MLTIQMETARASSKFIAFFGRIPVPLYRKVMRLKGPDVKVQGVLRRALELWVAEQEQQMEEK